MAILIRRSVVRDDDKPLYVDAELEGSTLILGSAADSAVQLSGLGVAKKHVEIRASDSNAVAQLRSFGPAVTLVNGNRVQRHSLQIGDEIEVGSNLITIIAAPAGFKFAMQVQQGDLGSANNLEKSYRTDLQQTGLSKRTLAWLLVAFVIAVGLMMPLLLSSVESDQQIGLSAKSAWTSGPLHLAHQDATKGDCSACHTEPFVRVADKACTQCHATISEHALVDKAVDNSVDNAVKGDSTAGSVVDNHVVPRCASCHVEHGEPAALVSPATNHCQGCHGVSQFAKDHPEFSNYPNIGRTRLIFDHQQHAGKHFGKTEREFACVQCHQPDANGRQMVAGSFQSMCVDCHGSKESTRANVLFHHGNQIIAGDDLALFTLPRLDLKTLAAEGVAPSFGYWPPETKGSSRSGLSRLGLTPMTELLISTDPKIALALELLRKKKTKLASLRRASVDELKAVNIIVTALKGLLAQLAEDPEGALATRLEPILARQLQTQELTALGGGLTPMLVRRVAKQWFADAPEIASAKSVQAYLDAPSVAVIQPFVERLALTVPGVGGAQLGTWHEEKYSLRYTLSGHGDAFVRAWIAMSAEMLMVLPKTDTPAGLRVSVQAAYDLLVDDDAKVGAAKGVGRCTKCHDLQQTQPQNLFSESTWQGSWRSRAPGRALFAHQPHLRGTQGESLLDKETCSQCHVTSEANDYLPQAYSEKADLPSGFEIVANFKALSPDQCAQCHTPASAASDACLQCHAYHPTGHSQVPLPWQPSLLNSGFESKKEPK